jgi:ABC-type Mn2+/Zn2+ transport system permease subunit
MEGPQVFANSTTLLNPKAKQFNKFHHKALLAFSIINIIFALISCVLMVTKWSLFDLITS